MSNTAHTDKRLTCKDCGRDFVFTAGEQKYYAERLFTDPKRCPECRRAKKANYGESARG